MDSEFTVKNYNSLIDLAPVIEREIERSLAYCLVYRPKETLQAILDKKIDFQIDEDATIFWNNVKPRIGEISQLGEDAAVARLFVMLPYRTYCAFMDSYNDYESPVNPETIVNDLAWVRLLRRSLRYINQRGMIERIFSGRVEL